MSWSSAIRRTRARVIFLTGDVQSDSTQRFIEERGRASVMKPFTFDELTRVVLAQARSLMASVLIVDDERPVTDAFAAFFERTATTR